MVDRSAAAGHAELVIWPIPTSLDDGVTARGGSGLVHTVL